MACAAQPSVFKAGPIANSPITVCDDDRSIISAMTALTAPLTSALQ